MILMVPELLLSPLNTMHSFYLFLRDKLEYKRYIWTHKVQNGQ